MLISPKSESLKPEVRKLEAREDQYHRYEFEPATILIADDVQMK